MSSASAHPSTAKAPTAGGGKSTSATPGKPAEPEPSPVSYFGLWRFATWLDVLFAVLGVIAGVGNGVVFPLFTLVCSSDMRPAHWWARRAAYRHVAYRPLAGAARRGGAYQRWVIPPRRLRVH